MLKLETKLSGTARKRKRSLLGLRVLAAAAAASVTVCGLLAGDAGGSQTTPLASEPGVEQILERMMHADRLTTPQLRNYTSIRKYELENKRFGKKASMTVRMRFRNPGRKEFEVLEEHGSATIRSRVFRRMLATEVETSGDQLREATRITPQNYSFRLLGSETLEGRRSFILEATPRTKNAYLFRGKVWVDAEDWAISRIEGSPAKNPSAWVRRTVFVHRYGKFGPFWLPVHNHSETDVVVFGKTEVNIHYSGYEINHETDNPTTGGGPLSGAH
jgi:hypothetical protein